MGPVRQNPIQIT